MVRVDELTAQNTALAIQLEGENPAETSHKLEQLEQELERERAALQMEEVGLCECCGVR